MVDFEDHRDSVYRTSRYDSYYKTVYYRERSRSYRSSRNDDYRYEESHKKYRSRRNDFAHRSRSRSRNYNRSNSRSRRDRRKRDLYLKQSELNYYPKPYNIYKYRSRSPEFIEHVNHKRHQQIRKPLLDVSTNCEFEITYSRNPKNLYKPYLVIENMIYEQENDLGSRKFKNSIDVFSKGNSLLGDGSIVQKMQSVPYHSEISLMEMCSETIDLMNSQFYNRAKIQHKKFEIDPESPASGQVSNFSINSNFVEPDNKIEIIDYNHLNFSFDDNDVDNTIHHSINNEAPVLMTHTNIQLLDTKNSTKNIEYLDQIKNLSNLVTQTDTKENIIKWRLIPLFAPLRTKITENNIDVNSCSEYDPRIQHIVKNRNCR